MAVSVEKNGKQEPSIEQMKEELERSHLQLRTNVLKRQLKLTESFFSSPLVGELINPLEQLYDGTRLTYPLYPFRRDSHHQNNLFQTEAQLDTLRAFARYVYDTNSYAQGAIRGLTNYTIKAGYTYDLTPLKGATPELQRQAQDVLDEFQEDQCWSEYEREIFTRVRRDGECFIRHFPQGDGTTKVRIVEPEQVRAPNMSPEWAFGILTDKDDLLDIKGYHVTYTGDPADGEFVPADEMVHIKANVDRNSRRGLSDFFCVGDQLESAKKLLRNEREGEAIRSAIAYMREHSQAPVETIRALQADSSDYQLGYTQPFSGRQVNVQRMEPGSVQDVPEGLTAKTMPGYDSSGGMRVLAATLQAIAVRWQVPYWLVSGDATASSFASSLTAESPFVKEVETQQDFFTKKYKKVLWKVLETAVEYGLLPGEATAFFDISVEAPPVTVRNKEEENSINSTLYNAGIMSAQTWAIREDLSYEDEQKQRAEERETLIPQGDLVASTVRQAINDPTPGPLVPTKTPLSTSPGAQQQREAPRP